MCAKIAIGLPSVCSFLSPRERNQQQQKANLPGAQGFGNFRRIRWYFGFPEKKSYRSRQLYNSRIWAEMQKDRERDSDLRLTPNDFSPACECHRDAHFLRDLLSQHGPNGSQNMSCLGSDEAMTSRRQGAQKFPRAQGQGSQKPKNISTNCWFFGPVTLDPGSWPYNHFLPRPFFLPLTRHLASRQKLNHGRC